MKRKRFKPLPCPFCGSKYSGITRFDGDVWRTCVACHSSTAAFTYAKDANKAWNKRAGK